MHARWHARTNARMNVRTNHPRLLAPHTLVRLQTCMHTQMHNHTHARQHVVMHTHYGPSALQLPIYPQGYAQNLNTTHPNSRTHLGAEAAVTNLPPGRTRCLFKYEPVGSCSHSLCMCPTALCVCAPKRMRRAPLLNCAKDTNSQIAGISRECHFNHNLWSRMV